VGREWHPIFDPQSAAISRKALMLLDFNRHHWRKLPPFADFGGFARLTQGGCLSRP
jgi:hypothetical protein